MSDSPEGSAVVTIDQIYAEVRVVSDQLIKLTERFEQLDELKKRVEKVEEKLEESQRGQWQVPVAWTSGAAGVAAAVWQAMHPGR